MIMEQKLCAACAALAVLALAMAVPHGTALARGGMVVRTADLCLVDYTLPEPEFFSEGIGTVAAVTDSRTKLGGGDWEPGTAWAVSLEGMLPRPQVYSVYNTESGASDCEGENPGNYLVYTIPTDEKGEAFQNSSGTDWTNNPVVGDVIQICRYDDNDGLILIPILEGVLVKGGKERNKPGRCR